MLCLAQVNTHKHGVEPLPRARTFEFAIMPPSSADESATKRSMPWKGIGCTEDPFRTGFHDRFVYLDADQKDRYVHLLRSVEAQEGLSLVTGPAGSGKTTLLRKLITDLQASDPLVLFFATPVTTLDALLFGCREQAGITGDDSSESANPLLACRELLSGFDPERSPVLLIDEAQSLPDKVLGDLLALGAPGAHGKSLLPIILAGDSSLARRMTLEPFRRQAHAIGYRCSLTPLAKPDVAAFIRHRLRAAGCTDSNPFADDAIERMADYANGIFGTLNTLCRLALFFAAEGEETLVTVRSVELAASATLLSKEPLRVSRFRAPKDSRIGRGNQTVGAAFKPIPAGNTPPSAIALDSEEPSLGPIRNGRAVDGSSDEAPATAGTAPIRARPRRAWAWLAAGVTAFLMIGAPIPLFPELQQVLLPNENPEPEARTGVDVQDRGFAATVGDESVPLGIDGNATAVISANESRSPAVATAPPIAGESELPIDRAQSDGGRDLGPAAFSLEPMETAYELHSTIAVHERPAVESVPIATLLKGDSVQVRSQIRGSNWYLIDVPEQGKGFIYAALIPNANPAAMSEAQTAPRSLGLTQLDETEAQASEIGRLLTMADEHVAADRLVAPRFENALAVYQRILRVNPGNPAALSGLTEIKAKLMSYAQAEADRGDPASARRQLKKIQSIDKELGTASNRSYDLTGELDYLGLSVPSVNLSDQ